MCLPESVAMGLTKCTDMNTVSQNVKKLGKSLSLSVSKIQAPLLSETPKCELHCSPASEVVLSLVSLH